MKYLLSSIYFIIVCFFVISCDKENSPPVAEFSITPEFGNTTTIFLMDASLSYDKEDTKDDLHVRWDWSNDNSADTDWATEKTIQINFSISGYYIIRLEVMDTDGMVGEFSKSLTVEYANKPPNIPEYISPKLNSNENDNVLELSWICSDPEYDSLEFDIYLDTNFEPRLIEANWQSNSYITDTLMMGENYYWKILARDSKGNISSGPLWYFTIKGDSSKSFTDHRDGNNYRMIKIGNQWWMAENLKYISNIGSVCYNLHNSNCQEYGRLYDFEAALNACPDGWHLPTDDEWKVLEKSIGMQEDEVDAYGLRGNYEGQKLKSTSGWLNDGNGTNESSFGALAAGQRSFISDFTRIGESASFWSSTYYSDWESWSRELYADKTGIYRINYHHSLGFSVRCIKD